MHVDTLTTHDSLYKVRQDLRSKSSLASSLRVVGNGGKPWVGLSRPTRNASVRSHGHLHKLQERVADDLVSHVQRKKDDRQDEQSEHVLPESVVGNQAPEALALQVCCDGLGF